MVIPGFLVPVLTGTVANNNIVLFNKNQYTWCTQQCFVSHFRPLYSCYGATQG